MDRFKNPNYYKCIRDNSEDKMDDSYQNVLMYFMEQYENKPSYIYNSMTLPRILRMTPSEAAKNALHLCSSSWGHTMTFVPEYNINIIGIRQYKPYNVAAVKKFHKLINK